MPPTRATSNLSARAMPSIQSQCHSNKNMPILYGMLYAIPRMRHDSPCTIRPSPHQLPHTMPKPMCEKLSFSMTSNHHFFDSLHFMWVVDFLCRTMGSTNPDTFTAFHYCGLCLTIIDGSFTLGRIYPNLLIPSAYCLLLFSYSVQLDEYLKYSFYPYDLVSFSSVFMLNKFPNALKFHTYDQAIHLVESCKIGGKTATKVATVF